MHLQRTGHSHLSLFVALAALAAVLPVAAAGDPPRTAAESSDFQATSSYAQVMEFCQALAKDSPVVRLSSLGKSHEGRDLPLLILADPPLTSAAEIANSKRLVVFVMANIHAGEVDGKEALLMLARDIAKAKERPQLRDLVIVLAPIFNADGNERLASHRPTQAGPQLVGTRTNAQELDLNRDFVKLESPEVQALVRFFVEVNPEVVIDCHTTNGSYHRYALTYEGGRHPAGNPRVVEYLRESLLPAVTERMEKASGYKSFFYGNFTAGHEQWETISPLPRYGTHYVGLRNRLAILSESYTYAPFKDRVLASKAFVQAIIEHVAENRATIREILLQASRKYPDQIVLRHDAAPLGGPVKILGYVEEMKEGKSVATDQPFDYEARYLGHAKATLSVARPFAYLLPEKLTAVAENLQRHGIEVDQLHEDIELDVEVYIASKLLRGEAFQKHELVSLEATSRKEARRLAAGTMIVRTDQPLGILAAYLLEPQSTDGLAAWNFFDSELKEGGDFPVIRLPERTILQSGPLPPPRDYQSFQRRRPSRPFAGGITWLPDGEHYLQVKDGRLHKVQALSGRSESFFDPQKVRAGLRTLPAISEQAAAALTSSPYLRMNPERNAALFDHENDLYYCKLDGTGAARLTHTPAKEEIASFSPDGRFVAFGRGNNLYVIDVATQTERALTTDGSEVIFNAKADWVYYEEVFFRDERAYWWSPDSSQIAFLRLDDSPVRKFTLADPTKIQQENESTPYPKAGAANPIATVASVSVSGGEPKWADLGNYLPADRLIIRAGWSPSSEEFFFYVQNRAQTWLDVCFFSPASGKTTRFLRDSTQAWVDDPGEPKFVEWNEKTKSFLLPSERTGWKHFYQFAGEEGQPLTTGQWEARTLHFRDAGGDLFFSGTKDGSLGLNLYRIRTASQEIERLTKEEGGHQINFSPTGKYYIDIWSNHETPPQVRLFHADGRLARVLDSNPLNSPSPGEAPSCKLEFVQIATPDGFMLNASLLFPPNFDAQKKYPVWYTTYAGPRMPTLRNHWGAGRGQDAELARLGFIVFRCDPRSASGKGAISAWSAYKQLGVQELKDIEAAIGWLKTHEFVDGKRIGMSGHSYGGFMTAYAMTHSDLFAAGIAASPVTDWRNYDSIYTERYMQTPQENPEGYDKTSVVKAAGKLHGKLLLVHGLLDDNVHAQNTLQLVEALQAAGKDFELMIYPRNRHGVGGPHYQKLTIDFMKRMLRPGE